MATSSTEHEIGVSYTGQSEIGRATSDLEEFGQASEDLGRTAAQAGDEIAQGFDLKGTWTELASGIAVATTAFNTIQAAAQQAYEFISEGAALELAEERFNRLAETVGTTGETLRFELATATEGMISNAELMASATDIINLGFASTSSEVVRLSNVVGQLGWDMQTLTLTLANQSTARLDSLGLSITDVKGRMAELEAQGVATDQAFKLAVIEAGEAKIEELGSAADSTVGDLQRFEAGIANTTAGLKQMAAVTFAPVVSGLGDMFSAIERIRLAREAGLITDEDIVEANRREGLFAKDITEAQEELLVLINERYEAQQKEEAVQAAINATYDEYTTSTEKNWKQQQEIAELAELRQRQTAAAAEQEERITAAIERRTAKEIIEVGDQDLGVIDSLADKIAGVTTVVNAANAAWQDYTGEIEAFGGDVFSRVAQDPDQFDLAATIYQYADAGNAAAPALSDLGQSLGIFGEGAATAGEKAAQQEAVIRSIAQAAEEGKISWEEYGTAVDIALKRLEEPPPEPAAPPPVAFSVVPEFQQPEGGAPFYDDIDITVNASTEDSFTSVINTAVEEGRGVLEGFVEEPYSISADADGVRAGVDLALGFFEELPEEIKIPVIVEVSVTGDQDAIDAFRSGGG